MLRARTKNIASTKTSIGVQSLTKGIVFLGAELPELRELEQRKILHAISYDGRANESFGPAF